MARYRRVADVQDMRRQKKLYTWKLCSSENGTQVSNSQFLKIFPWYTVFRTLGISSSVSRCTSWAKEARNHAEVDIHSYLFYDSSNSVSVTY